MIRRPPCWDVTLVNPNSEGSVARQKHRQFGLECHLEHSHPRVQGTVCLDFVNTFIESFHSSIHRITMMLFYAIQRFSTP